MLWATLIISSPVIANSDAKTETTLNCFLQFERAFFQSEVFNTTEEFRGRLFTFIEKGNRLIYYTLTVSEDNGPFSSKSTDQTLHFKPYFLVLALDETGKSLLNLKDYFIPMSLYTLGYGVEQIDVQINQKPHNCLVNVSAVDLDTFLKLLVFRNFENSTLDILSDKEVCSKVIRTVKSEGKLKYRCCKLKFKDNLDCLDLDGNMWMGLMFIFIRILQVVVILFSPKFVPKKRRLSTDFVDYIHKPNNPLELNIVVVDTKTDIPDKEFLEAKMFPSTYLETLRMVVKECTSDVLYCLSISQVNIRVKASKILPDGYSPVRLVDFIKNLFIRCNKRNSKSPLKHCCNAKVLQSPCNMQIKPQFSGRGKTFGCSTCLWHKVLANVSRLVFLAILALPWIFRILFFYTFEETLVSLEINAFRKIALKRKFQWSLVLYFTPNHSLFIAIYVFVALGVICLSLFPSSSKRIFKRTIRWSVVKMTKANYADLFGLVLVILLWPFKRFGILGLFIFVLFLVFALFVGLITLCYTLPIVNYTIRLLVNLIYYMCPSEMKRFPAILTKHLGKFKAFCKTDIIVPYEHEEKQPNASNHHVPLIFYTITFGLLLVLVFECIAFYIECGVYIFVGIILNSDRIMKFLALFVLIAWYAFDCFSSVSTRYETFAKVINSEIKEKVSDQAKKVAMRSQRDQTEQAFTVPVKEKANKPKMRVVVGSKRRLKWVAKNLLLFLDTSDIPHIPKDFFFKVADNGHFYSPGQVYILYLKACMKLVPILLFLCFVMLVVLAFGDARNISGTNQTLATLAGGFLPLAFKKCFLKSNTGPQIDKSNMAWIAKLEECITDYSARWPISDLKISTCVGKRKVDIKNESDLHDVVLIVKPQPYSNDGIQFLVQETETPQTNKPDQKKSQMHVDAEFGDPIIFEDLQDTS